MSSTPFSYKIIILPQLHAHIWNSEPVLSDMVSRRDAARLPDIDKEAYFIVAAHHVDNVVRLLKRIPICVLEPLRFAPGLECAKFDTLLALHKGALRPEPRQPLSTSWRIATLVNDKSTTNALEISTLITRGIIALHAEDERTASFIINADHIQTLYNALTGRTDLTLRRIHEPAHSMINAVAAAKRQDRDATALSSQHPGYRMLYLANDAAQALSVSMADGLDVTALTPEPDGDATVVTYYLVHADHVEQFRKRAATVLKRTDLVHFVPLRERHITSLPLAFKAAMQQLSAARGGAKPLPVGPRPPSGPTGPSQPGALGQRSRTHPPIYSRHLRTRAP